MNVRAESYASSAADLISLTKPRLSTLVLITSAGGLWLAPAPVVLPKAIATLLSIAGIIGAANTLNCYIERDSDRFMRRTAGRPLPAGRMDPSVALWFGISLAVVSVPALAISANFLTAVLGLVALCSYVLVYTPLKSRTDWSMWVGAIPGALPPLMGWVAATGRLDAPGLALFGVLFLWQLPHTLAITLFRREEFEAAGLKSVPIAQGDAVARLQIVVLLVLLVPVTLLPYVYGIAGPIYLICAVALGLVFVGYGVVGWLRQLGTGWARQLFLISLIYLTGLFGALTWDVLR